MAARSATRRQAAFPLRRRRLESPMFTSRRRDHKMAFLGDVSRAPNVLDLSSARDRSVSGGRDSASRASSRAATRERSPRPAIIAETSPVLSRVRQTRVRLLRATRVKIRVLPLALLRERSFAASGVWQPCGRLAVTFLTPFFSLTHV